VDAGLKAMQHGLFLKKRLAKAISDGFCEKEEHMFTLTGQQRLAKEILEDLERVAAKIPKLEYVTPGIEDIVRAHVNVPRQFMRSTVSLVEQSDELTAIGKLDPREGHGVLQFLEAFQTVQDRLSGMSRELKFTMKVCHAKLAWQSLQIYAIARGMVRDGKSPEMAAYVSALRRDLGPRGRPRKKKSEE
jgi:hypothetical protein